MIYYKAGDKQMAKLMIGQANGTTSYIDPSLQAATMSAMKNL